MYPTVCGGDGALYLRTTEGGSISDAVRMAGQIKGYSEHMPYTGRHQPRVLGMINSHWKECQSTDGFLSCRGIYICHKGQSTAIYIYWKGKQPETGETTGKSARPNDAAKKLSGSACPDTYGAWKWH